MKTVSVILLVLILTACGQAETTGTNHTAEEPFVYHVEPEPEKFEEISAEEPVEEPVEEPSVEITEEPVEEPAGFLQLPAAADSIEGFLLEDWSLLRYAELDFNSDGLTDIIGIMANTESDSWQPFILFALRRTEDGYLLDFQDFNIVTTGAGEIFGPFGETYETLTTDGNTFTVIAARDMETWRWDRHTTFEYRDGTWYLARRLNRYGLNYFLEGYELDDYTTGIGTIRLNSGSLETMDFMYEHVNYESDFPFELEFTIMLEPAPSIEELSRRRLPLGHPGSAFEAEEIIFAPHIIPVNVPTVPTVQYVNESYILYSFHNNIHLALHNRESRITNVFYSSTDRSFLNAAIVYQDEVYLRAMSPHPQILRVGMDGTEEIIFEYPDEASLVFYASGGELIVTVFTDENHRRLYRMNTDGSDVREIGEVRGFYQQ